MSGRPRQFKVDFRICFTPLPPEKLAAYQKSMRLLAGLILDGRGKSGANKEIAHERKDPHSLVQEA